MPSATQPSSVRTNTAQMVNCPQPPDLQRGPELLLLTPPNAAVPSASPGRVAPYSITHSYEHTFMGFPSPWEIQHRGVCTCYVHAPALRHSTVLHRYCRALQVSSIKGLCIRPPVQFAELFPVIQHPPSPQNRSSHLGGAGGGPSCSLACTLQLQPSSPSQPARNAGLGLSSPLCSSPRSQPLGCVGTSKG